ICSWYSSDSPSTIDFGRSIDRRSRSARCGMGADVIHFLRRMRVTWAMGALSAWLPPVDETVVAFRPLPWELDGRGGLSPVACRRMLDLSCRNWFANSGLVANRPARWPSAAEADEIRFDGPIAAL